MQNKNSFIKSPMNYPGNKYKLLSQLYPLFPTNINNFVDLFCGGTDVSINTSAINKYANDIDNNIISIYQAFQNKNIEEILSFIDSRIREFQLTKLNADGYLQYRDLYNTTLDYHTPLDLFTLSRFSFNQQIRFNTKQEYNSAFGLNRGGFNLVQRANTRAMHAVIQNIHFTSMDFRKFNLEIFNNPNDFLYVDPPYLISNAIYNKGSKKTNDRWELQDDLDLYAFLDKANEQGIKWALSNVLVHNGQENEALINWCEKYQVYDIFSDYFHASHSKKPTTESTIEVLVTNYKK